VKVEPAAGLSEEARKKWLEMQEEYSITDGQGILLLDAMFEAWDQMADAQEKLKKEGSVTENPSTGYQRAHPAAGILKDARQAYLKALSMLNLDVEDPGPVGRPAGT
jgi:P27 family predicted phage terminase small subunit